VCAAKLPRSIENTNAPGLQFRACISGVVERLAPMRNRKTVVDGFAFSVLLTEGDIEHFKLTKA